MKTAFMSSENISCKKKFQKPNILRRKSAAPVVKARSMDAMEPLDTRQLDSNSCSNEEMTNDLSMMESTVPLHLSNALKPAVQELGRDTITNHKVVSNLTSDNCDEANAEENMNMKNDENSNQALVNIEAFFNDTSGENVMLYDIDFEHGKPIETIMVIDNESPMNGMFIEQSPNVMTNMVPLSAVTSQYEEQNETEPAPNIFLPTSVNKYKCDAPNCKKIFRSEQKFLKHKSLHNADGTIKPARQVTVECPVKRVEADGTEITCGRIFLVRELLLKHLNEEHVPDDAAYRCDECGRRFFWASGLRAHARAHCRQAAAAGAALVCGWSGCGRVFRQPCRLREHARAHTGDRPYHCQFPECNWSFRSSSKLARHLRRHTGERRHVCAECGHAFLRREHLRDHHARYHARTRLAVACTHPGCDQTFNNMSTLYIHMKKIHKSNEVSVPETATADKLLPKQEEDTFLVHLAPDTTDSTDLPEAVNYESAEATAATADDNDTADVADIADATNTADMTDTIDTVDIPLASGSWRAARTHCTWPLPRVVASPPPEEYSVEQSESSESNIYTVRSDLFLHGNVLINDDSQQSGGGGDALDAHLGMLDAHPAADLMQEELLYADVQGEESSFRIFLLSGEELA